MAQSTRTFRIFVSSTFSDLKAERNALQERVFPRLRDLCQQHGARFQVIDLRWGVSEEASLDQQAMKICLGEIERCQAYLRRQIELVAPRVIVVAGRIALEMRLGIQVVSIHQCREDQTYIEHRWHGRLQVRAKLRLIRRRDRDAVLHQSFLQGGQFRRQTQPDRLAQ